MVEIAMHESSEDFALCRQPAGWHLQRRTGDAPLSWLKADLNPGMAGTAGGAGTANASANTASHDQRHRSWRSRPSREPVRRHVPVSSPRPARQRQARLDGVTNRAGIG